MCVCVCVFVYFRAFFLFFIFSFMPQIQLELFVLTKAKAKQMQKNSNESTCRKRDGETVKNSMFCQFVYLCCVHTRLQGLIILRNSIMGKPIFRFDLIFAAICHFVCFFFFFVFSGETFDKQCTVALQRLCATGRYRVL